MTCSVPVSDFSLKTADELTAEQAAAVQQVARPSCTASRSRDAASGPRRQPESSIGVHDVRPPNYPAPIRVLPARVQLDLLPFGEQALQTFLSLERPEGMERQDAGGSCQGARP